MKMNMKKSEMREVKGGFAWVPAASGFGRGRILPVSEYPQKPQDLPSHMGRIPGDTKPLVIGHGG